MIHTSILHRHPVQARGELSPLQSQLDGLVSGFVHEAANPRTLAALTAGGMAYRVGRGAVLSCQLPVVSQGIIRPLSFVVGLGSEVTAFEFTNRTLHTLAGGYAGPPLQNASRLWSWSGPGGWQQGLLSSFLTFGTLRGAGFLTREQNLILQHAFQSSAMVAGHNATGILGISPRPEGNLGEQFLHAEVTNLQLSAGMGLAHALTPGVHAFEQGLDLRFQIQGGAIRESPLRKHFESFVAQPVTAGPPSPSPLKGEGKPRLANVLMSSTEHGNGGWRFNLYDHSPTLRSAGERVAELDPVSFIRHLRDLQPDLEKEVGHRYALTTLMDAVAKGAGRLPQKRVQTYLYTAGAADLVEKLPDPAELTRFYSALSRSEIFLQLILLKPYFQQFKEAAPGVGYLLLGLRVLGLTEAKDGPIDDTTIHYANTLDQAYKNWTEWGPHFQNLSLIPKRGELMGWTRSIYAREHLRKKNKTPYATTPLNALIRWGIFLYQNRKELNLPEIQEIPLALRSPEPSK